MKINDLLNPLEIRKDLLYIVNKSNASHLGTCLSCVEILSAVYSSVNVEKIKNGDNDRDRVILSKGHAAAALYTTMCRVGLIERSEYETYYSNGSLLSGHSNHFHPKVEHSTGALGHGLSVGVGACLGFKAKKYDSKVFVILGDGELNEGTNYEAMMYAGHVGLSNLTVLVDHNNLGGVRKTSDICTIEPLADKFRAFNFATHRVNGHDLNAILECINDKNNGDCPKVIICDTVKGKGVPFMESQNAWHYRPLNNENYAKALAELY